MNKYQFLAMSLPYGLYLGQHRYGKIEPYLFYGMKQVKCVDKISCYIDDKKHGDYQNSWIDGVFPILRPLSDYRDLEDILGLIYCNEIFRVIKGWQKIEDLPFKVIQELVKNHFDICGLIESGEAVDYHTLPDFVF